MGLESDPGSPPLHPHHALPLCQHTLSTVEGGVIAWEFHHLYHLVEVSCSPQRRALYVIHASPYPLQVLAPAHTLAHTQAHS
jgi:biotin carboxylase